MDKTQYFNIDLIQSAKAVNKISTGMALEHKGRFSATFHDFYQATGSTEFIFTGIMRLPIAQVAL